MSIHRISPAGYAYAIRLLVEHAASEAVPHPEGMERLRAAIEALGDLPEDGELWDDVGAIYVALMALANGIDARIEAETEAGGIIASHVFGAVEDAREETDQLLGLGDDE